jgi:hypothetical protein
VTTPEREQVPNAIRKFGADDADVYTEQAEDTRRYTPRRPDPRRESVTGGYTEAVIRPVIRPVIERPFTPSVTPRTVFVCSHNGSRVVCPTCGRPSVHNVFASVGPREPLPDCRLHGYLTRQEANP